MRKNRVQVVWKLQKKEVRLFTQHAKRTEESQELYSGFNLGTSMTPTYKERNIACLSNTLLSEHHLSTISFKLGMHSVTRLLVLEMN
jgi:hypothetical protein